MYTPPHWKEVNGENDTEEGRGKSGGGGKGGGGGGKSEDIWKAQKLILKGLTEVKQGQAAMTARVQATEEQLYAYCCVLLLLCSLTIVFSYYCVPAAGN
jgi:hypothetical protein